MCQGDPHTAGWRVLYVAVLDLRYPRNHRIREYLLSRGAQVNVVPLPMASRRSYLLTCVDLLLRTWRQSRGCQVVVLAEFGLQYAWVGKLIARLRRSVFVVDWFVGMYETNIEDWGERSPASIKARLYRLFDVLAARLADLVLTDTSPRAKHLESTLSVDTPVNVLPVGAPQWARPSQRTNEVDRRTPLRLLYYGNYLPLHGVQLMIEAVRLVRPHRDVVLSCIGPASGRDRVLRMLPESDLADACEFLDPMPELELVKHIHHTDVVFGIFGTSSKAATVVANKVWQGLACGKLVITRDSPALTDAARLFGDQLITVPPGSAASIASAIVSLDMPVRRFRDASEALEGYVTCHLDQFYDSLSRLISDD